MGRSGRHSRQLVEGEAEDDSPQGDLRGQPAPHQRLLAQPGAPPHCRLLPLQLAQLALRRRQPLPGGLRAAWEHLRPAGRRGAAGSTVGGPGGVAMCRSAIPPGRAPRSQCDSRWRSEGAMELAILAARRCSPASRAPGRRRRQPPSAAHQREGLGHLPGPQDDGARQRQHHPRALQPAQHIISCCRGQPSAGRGGGEHSI